LERQSGSVVGGGRRGGKVGRGGDEHAAAAADGAEVLALCVTTAEAVEESTTRRMGFCRVTVTNQHYVVVGHFRGTVYRTSRAHALPDDAPAATT
jgi:hypothetical protein